MKKLILTSTIALALSQTAFAGDHSHSMGVKAKDQDLSGGSITADKVMAGENGWLVIHRTDSNMKPGPVVGYAPLKKGKNKNVTALLTEPVNKGEMLMVMLHTESNGKKTGIFEYTLGAKVDGPVKKDGKLIMDVITAK